MGEIKIVLVGPGSRVEGAPERIRKFLQEAGVANVVIVDKDGPDVQTLYISENRLEEMSSKLEFIIHASEFRDPCDPQLRRKLRKRENREQFRSKRERRHHR